MMPTIKIGFTESAEKVLAGVKEFPAAMRRSVARSMDQQNLLTVSRIQQDYMSFPKDQPATLQGLRVITNRLRASVRASKTEISGDHITSAIGSNVKYAAIHEFGGVIHRTVKPGSVRLRTNAAGDLLLQPGRRGAVFAANRHKRVRTVQFVGGKSYDTTIPARAPIQKGIADRIEEYKGAVSEAIVESWNKN